MYGGCTKSLGAILTHISWLIRIFPKGDPFEFQIGTGLIKVLRFRI